MSFVDGERFTAMGSTSRLLVIARNSVFTYLTSFLITT